jgi:hypothetical protein
MTGGRRQDALGLGEGENIIQIIISPQGVVFLHTIVIIAS